MHDQKRILFYISTASSKLICNQFSVSLFMDGTSSECCCVLCVQVGIWPTQPYLDIHLTSHPPGRAATPRPHWLEWFLVSIFCNWQNRKQEHVDAPQLLKMFFFFLNAQYKNNAMEFIFTFKCIKNKCNHYDSALWKLSLCHVPIFQSIVGQTNKQIVPPNIMLLVESLARFPLQIWAKLCNIF